MRRLPVEGAEVTVVYLGTTEPGVIAQVHDEGRTLDVETLRGELLRFRLNATGWFVTADRSARLKLASE
jgi:hypothetical protein